MATLIVLPADTTGAQLERIWDDMLEAIAYEASHDIPVRCVLKGFDKNDLPLYERIPDDEIAWVEWLAAKAEAIPVEIPVMENA